jgi:hypothetical protein
MISTYIASSQLADEANFEYIHTVSIQTKKQQQKIEEHRQTQYLLIPKFPGKPSQVQSD